MQMALIIIGGFVVASSRPCAGGRSPWPGSAATALAFAQGAAMASPADASAGLLAWIALSKYVDHAPLYRLEQMSARWGATLPRQSMADWIGITAGWLEPIYRRMKAELLAGGYVQADETPVRCNDPDEKRGGTTQGWLWVISRPGGDVVFDWRLSRRHGELTAAIRDKESEMQ